MKWQECFKKYDYRSLITEDGVLDIGMFLVDGKVPGELRQIYESKYGDELFLILQPKPGTNMNTFCNSWDEHIMAFVNFGELREGGHEAVKKLQYNITQIILYTEKKGICETGNLPLMNRPDSFAEEKSVSVSRKIFIPCGSNDNFDSDSRILLPFWYDELKGEIFNQENEENLTSLLPDNGTASFLCKERIKIDHRARSNSADQLNFTEEEFVAVKGWLEL